MTKLEVFMHEDEKPFFFDSITPDSNVLEWGSGGSTVALFNHTNVKHIVSIEHNEGWFTKVNNEISKETIAEEWFTKVSNEISKETIAEDRYSNKLMYLYRPPIFDHDYNKHGDGSLTQFYTYVNAPCSRKIDEVFDIILIDGRARPYCAQIAPLVSHIDTKIFIHDFQFSYAGRENYKLAFESLDLVEQVHDMAMFKPKPECCKGIK